MRPQGGGEGGGGVAVMVSAERAEEGGEALVVVEVVAMGYRCLRTLVELEGQACGDRC